MVKKIPVKIDYDFHTKAKQNKKTGLMMGRERVKNFGDYTPVIRVQKSVDVDNDGENDFEKGQILGRASAEKGRVHVRANRRQRAYTR